MSWGTHRTQAFCPPPLRFPQLRPPFFLGPKHPAPRLCSFPRHPVAKFLKLPPCPHKVYSYNLSWTRAVKPSASHSNLPCSPGPKNLVHMPVPQPHQRARVGGIRRVLLQESGEAKV